MEMTHIKQFLLRQHLLIVLTFFFISISNTHAENLTVPVSSGEEIVVEHFPASGKYLMLWFAPEYGLRDTHRALARSLSEQHIEIWLTNLMDSLFLPVGSKTIKELKGDYAADMIEYAHKLTGKKIIVAGDSYASVIALRGAHRWQQKQLNEPYLIGGVLFSPYTYAAIPQLGQLPDYLPIVSATTIPLMIYQAQNSAIIGQYATLLGQLQQHGNPVYTRFMPDIMSLFYLSEPTVYTQKQTKPLPTHIRKMIAVLEQHPVPSKAIPINTTVATQSGIDIQLNEFKGHTIPVAIELPDIHGNTIIKKDFKGKVTIINFWATWCAPCLEEIPSLNRLKNKMHDVPFELISINYAEDKRFVVDFMNKVHVEFPVLLDQNGEFATQWNVISYPSTFVIDTNGKIRYGVNAAIEWDKPEIVEKIKSLI
jgi:thiol-disulfide isomerase/thioredoxin